MDDLLSIEDLAVSFGQNQVLDGIDMRMLPGQRQALIGPNGAGKTTLLNVLSGWLKPHRGRVRFGGEVVLGHPPHRLPCMGIARVSQIPVGFPKLTVRQHLEAACQRGRGWWRYGRDLHTRVEAHAHRFALADDLAVPANALSHGARKRLELATASALQPKLLLLDEPTAGLSPAETEAVVAAVRGLDATLLIVEHDMAVVAALAQRVNVLYQGKILTQGTPDEIAADERVQRIYLGHAAR